MKTIIQYVKKKVFIVILLFTLSSLIFLYYWRYAPASIAFVKSLPELPLPTGGQTVMILAPHADDEILGAGGFIIKALQNQARVIVVLVTNGDGHRFTTIEEFHHFYPTADNYIQTGYRRQEESRRALKILGVPDENLIFLGYPDNGLNKMITSYWDHPYKSPYTQKTISPYNNNFRPNAAYTGKNLQEDIQNLFNQYQPNLIITSHPADLHPDHSALGKLTKNIIYQEQVKCDLYFYLIHHRFFPNSKGLNKNQYLIPPKKLISLSNQWYRLNLNQDILVLKNQAQNQYQSQLSSPFLRQLMNSFLRKNELLSKNH